MLDTELKGRQLTPRTVATPFASVAQSCRKPPSSVNAVLNHIVLCQSVPLCALLLLRLRLSRPGYHPPAACGVLAHDQVVSRRLSTRKRHAVPLTHNASDLWKAFLDKHRDVLVAAQLPIGEKAPYVDPAPRLWANASASPASFARSVRRVVLSRARAVVICGRLCMCRGEGKRRGRGRPSVGPPISRTSH